jgi:hypothetical protein
MHKRVDAGTDVAMIGAWDASRGESPLANGYGKAYDKTLEDDAAEGHLFLIHTGADCGGPVDVYVDAEVPEELRKIAKPVEGEFLIRVPTGRLVVGGVEDYRSAKPRITAGNSIVSIPSGDYRLRCYVGEEEQESPSEADLKKLVGAENLRYFDRINGIGVTVGFLSLLLFPILTVFLRWYIALPITLVVFFSYFHLFAWAVKQNARYRELDRVVPAYRLAKGPSMFILELRRVTDITGLKGGSIRL